MAARFLAQRTLGVVERRVDRRVGVALGLSLDHEHAEVDANTHGVAGVAVLVRLLDGDASVRMLESRELRVFALHVLGESFRMLDAMKCDLGRNHVATFQQAASHGASGGNRALSEGRDANALRAGEIRAH